MTEYPDYRNRKSHEDFGLTSETMMTPERLPDWQQHPPGEYMQVIAQEIRGKIISMEGWASLIDANEEIAQQPVMPDTSDKTIYDACEKIRSHYAKANELLHLVFQYGAALQEERRAGQED